MTSTTMKIDIPCNNCGSINELEDIYCLECGIKLDKTSKGQKYYINDKIIALDFERKSIGSVNALVYEKNTRSLMYKISNNMNYSDLLNISSILLIITIEASFSIFITTILPKEFNLSIIGSMVTGVVIVIALLAISFPIFINLNNKMIHIKIRTGNNFNIGLVKVKGIGQNQWSLFNNNGNKKYSLIFTTNSEGFIKSNNSSFAFIVNPHIFLFKALNKENGAQITIGLDRKKNRRTTMKRYLSIEANKNIDESLILFFTIVMIQKYLIVASS